MGKNKDLDILIRLIANTIVHEIVIRHTNRPESEHFLESEIIEYRGQAKKTAKSHNWNNDDKQYVEDNAQIKIKEKLKIKYSDVLFKDEEIVKNLKKIVNELM